jgi:hypothetical protein
VFRVVSEFIPKPLFYLLCDHRSCCVTGTGEIPVAFPVITQEAAVALTQTQARFLNAAGAAGWLLGLDGQFCPEHAKAMRGQAAETRRLIEVASAIPSILGNGGQGRKQ